MASKNWTIEDTPESRHKLSQLCREQFKYKLLADITWDLQVCELDDSDPTEYITDLKKMIDELYNKITKLNYKKKGQINGIKTR